MGNCLNCKHFGHKKDSSGYVTSERVCAIGNQDVMNNWFNINKPYGQLPPVPCWESEIYAPPTNHTSSFSYGNITPIGYDEVTKKLKVKEHCCFIE